MHSQPQMAAGGDSRPRCALRGYVPPPSLSLTQPTTPLTWYLPCASLATCSVPLKPRFTLRRLAVRMSTRGLPSGCSGVGPGGMCINVCMHVCTLVSFVAVSSAGPGATLQEIQAQPPARRPVSHPACRLRGRTCGSFLLPREVWGEGAHLTACRGVNRDVEQCLPGCPVRVRGRSLVQLQRPHRERRQHPLLAVGKQLLHILQQLRGHPSAPAPLGDRGS